MGHFTVCYWLLGPQSYQQFRWMNKCLHFTTKKESTSSLARQSSSSLTLKFWSVPFFPLEYGKYLKKRKFFQEIQFFMLIFFSSDDVCIKNCPYVCFWHFYLLINRFQLGMYLDGTLFCSLTCFISRICIKGTHVKFWCGFSRREIGMLQKHIKW